MNKVQLAAAVTNTIVQAYGEYKMSALAISYYSMVVEAAEKIVDVQGEWDADFARLEAKFLTENDLLQFVVIKDGVIYPANQDLESIEIEAGVAELVNTIKPLPQEYQEVVLTIMHATKAAMDSLAA